MTQNVKLLPGVLPERDFLTPREFAARRGKNVRTIANWRILGKGPKYEYDGLIRYPMKYVLEWEATLLRSNTAGNASPTSLTHSLPEAKKSRGFGFKSHKEKTP